MNIKGSLEESSGNSFKLLRKKSFLTKAVRVQPTEEKIYKFDHIEITSFIKRHHKENDNPRTEIKYLQPVEMTKNLFSPKSIKNEQHSRKMNQKLKQAFHRRNTHLAFEHMKRWSTSLILHRTLSNTKRGR